MAEVYELTMQEKTDDLLKLIRSMFPDATFVSITVNSDGIKVEPRYMSKPPFCSIKNISGEWMK